MELWIRNQARNKLIRINELYVDIPKDFGSDGFGIYCVSTLENYGFVKLGMYKTKERALEVLDEIQEFMTLDEEHYEGKNKVAYQQCNMYKSNLLMIYEMPQE